MAIAFGGDPIKPGIFSGTEVIMNEYRRLSLQYLASSFRSHISPMGIPKQLSMYGCKTTTGNKLLVNNTKKL